MKVVEKLTQRLDHMVPERRTLHVNRKEIDAFLNSLAREEKRLGKKK